MSSPQSPGVIEKNAYGTVFYRSKELDSSERSKRLFHVVYWTTTLLIPLGLALITFAIVTHDEDLQNLSKDEQGSIVMAILAYSVQGGFTFTFASATFYRCYAVQYVECGLLRRSFNRQYVCFDAVFLLWQLVCMGNFPRFIAEQVTLLISFQCCQLAWFLACEYFQRKLCKCKKCNNIKDVKLCYSDQNLYVDEKQIITSEFLLRKFGIPRSSDNFPALQTEDGKIIHTFSNDSSVHLHEGRYNVIVRSTTGVNIRYMAGNGSRSAEEQSSTSGVHIRYLPGNVSKSIAASTVINEHLLKKWLKINTNGTIGIENDRNGRIVHIFHNQREEITLAQGNYSIKVIHIENETEATVASTSDLVVYTAQGSTVTIAEERKEPECTILTVD